uniref:Gamma-aminobutyric acid receptor subunit beta-like n=1 Tax=Dermatophagoides pteronyssinus TaxID=6956 RepID=A0A6P6XKP2_DERPT|nr:gamma-aminobutyric acid receptor subunit beta-like [Dermatophagoides pteronyssinus]
MHSFQIQTIIIWSILSLNTIQICQCSSDVLKISEMVRNMVSRRHYNKDIRPDYGSGQPLIVNVRIAIHAIYDISDVNMDFTIDLHFRQYWRDSRLKFEPIGNVTRLFMGGDFYQLIWLPDTFFLNGKSFQTHKSTASTGSNTLIELDYNGSILYSTRMTVVASCPMDLSYFPADRQRCQLNFGSYGYTIDDIIYKWSSGEIILEDRNLATFTVSNLNNSHKIRHNDVGTFSHLILYIDIERSIGYYLYQTFIPAFLIVLISWIPFWLGHDDHVERVAIGVTTVLTITTLITSTMESLPKISYVKALDIYLFVCFIMVFLSLIEYAMVGYYEHSHRYRFIHRCLCLSNTNTAVVAGQSQQSTNQQQQQNILESRIFFDQQSSKIDYYSRWLFPIIFILFNTIYIWFMISVKEFYHHDI